MRIAEIASLILRHEGFGKLTGKLSNGSSTLLELFENKVNETPNEKIFGQITKKLETEYMTFSEAGYCMKKLGQYISTVTEPREIVGIASVNRPEWVIAEVATYHANCINNAMHITFDTNSMSYIFFLTKLKILIVSSSLAEGIIKKLNEGLLKDQITLKRIILMDHDPVVIQLCKNAGFEVISYGEILFGDAKLSNPSDLNSTNEFFSMETTFVSKISKYLKDKSRLSLIKPIDSSRGLPKPEDVASYCFTSGTSGAPKGVTLTHSNFIYQIEAAILGGRDYKNFNMLSSDIYMSYLPISHVLERICISIGMSKGARICFFSGVRENIHRDITIIKPSFLAAVPLVIRTFYEKIEQKINQVGFFKKMAFRAALYMKIKVQKYGIFKIPGLDNLFFKQVADGFGGNLRGCLCGGASIDSYLLKYLQAVLNARIFQGYGQTEGLGANIVSTLDDNNASSVGIPFPSTLVKLVSFNPSSEDCGETLEKRLLLKGPAVTSGYFKPSESDYEILSKFEEYKNIRKSLSENIFDDEGFLITGDIATYVDGKIKIVGRDKDLIKLDNGEYISPEDIEGKIQSICKFEELYLTKSATGSSLTAIIGVTETNIDEKAVIKSMNDAYASLVATKVIPKNVKIGFVAVLKGFVRKDFPSMYTPKETKKRFVSASNGKFYETITKARPNFTSFDKKENSSKVKPVAA